MARKIFRKLLTVLWMCTLTLDGNSQQSIPHKYRKIQGYLDQACRENLAGVIIYIRSPKYGEWTATSGYSNLRDKNPLQKEAIFSLASIGKMYTAVAVLKLAESDSIRLDSKIAEYLPREIVDSLPNGASITVRNLLSHRSGLVNYETDQDLNRRYLSGEIKLDTLTHLNALRRYVYGKPALCLPGTEFKYSSTNYLLLAMLIDRMVPEGHTVYFRRLLNQYGFTNSFYRETPTHDTIHYYGGMLQGGVPEDLTAKTVETTNWFMGDDGVYAPVREAAHFLDDLMKGKILQAQSLKEMTTWNDDKKPDYGLGLMADRSFPYKMLLGHSGRGIGSTADLYYFPRQDMTIAIFCNTGLRGGSPEFKKSYYKMRKKIIKKLFLF